MNKDLKNTWWSVPLEDIFNTLSVDPSQGLSDAQVIEYRKKFGSNSITEHEIQSWFSLIVEGFKEPMMLLLLSIAFLSLLFGKIIEAIAMIFVVCAYISVECINKFRNNKIMNQLKNFALPTTKVMRNGGIIEIKTTDVVVGDILILYEGVIVAADARLIHMRSLIINEASLTGEPFPISKDANVLIKENVPLSERINCIFSGTTVLNGEGTAIVMNVGTESEFGKIAQQVQEIKKEQTILQKSMTKLAKTLALFALFASALIPMIGFLRGLNFQEMILTWLSLTFLMIPGQPPIIITMALALASFALAKKQIIVKRLHGIEIIGQITSIVSDKTGTITESNMKIETFYTIDGTEKKLSKEIQKQIRLALPDYCNDPTDLAVFESLDVQKKDLKQIDFFGFSDKRPWRDLTYIKNDNIIHALAGKPEIIIEHSQLNDQTKQKLKDEAQQQASLGKRITAYAFVENNNKELHNLMDLHFVALAIIKDPVRKGVKESIEKLEKAFVKTFIVTGDYKVTAKEIASLIGITGEIITGEEFDTLRDKNDLGFEKSHIFARMDPSQKLRLVQMLQKNNEIVAVIGDGVNDAPALKAADVGISMGKIGTDLAKEVSDLILTDDNYVHIPEAIEIGRNALNNFKKGLTYYLSAKSILLIIFLVPLFIGIPFPFAPIQIILIELLMDLASSTIFVTEKIESDLMEKPSEKINDFLGASLIFKIIKNSIPLASGILFIYLRTYQIYDVSVAQTAAFVSWLLGHILLALNLKQSKMPLIIQGIFSNTFGLIWLISMILLSIIITCVPQLYPYMRTTWLPIFVWIELITVIIITTYWIEIIKIIKYKQRI